MKQHTLIQGTPEWHAHRAQHFNASDAPAMLGCSPYTTRTQLLHKLHTGLTAEVDNATQRRFDDGHRFEALARPLAEEIIGDDLAPVVGTVGELSASFDGLTLMGDTAFEHKSLNDELRGCMKDQGNGYGLPKHYRVQMEQQLLVSEAERVLFMASKWDGETLIEERHCWYASDPALRAEILAGWAQFAIDLAAYKPTEVLPAAVAEPVMQLPAVSVQMNGAIAVISNLDVFGAKLRAFVDGLDKNPSDDQAFANTEQAIKTLQKAQDALEAAEAGALAQTATIEEMRRTVGLYVETARTTRLMLEKMVKARKEQIRLEIMTEAHTAFGEYMESLNKRLGRHYMPAVPTDFPGVMKGKKTIASLRDAVDGETARAKIAASAIADKIQANLTFLREHGANHAFLFNDAAAIVQKAPDDFQTLVKSRLAEHKAAEEAKEAATRERIRQEEQAKAEKEAREKIAAEQRAQEAEERELARLAAMVNEAAKPAPAPAPVAAPTVVAQTPSVAPPARAKAPAASSPTADQIIDVLSLHFRVHESKVVEWLLEMDLTEASKRIAAEFA